MESDSIRYINLVLRRWWLVLLAAAITGGIAYMYRTNDKPVYTAEAKIFIGELVDPQSGSVGTLEYANKLAVIYGQVAARRDVLQATIDALDVPLPPEYVPLTPEILGNMTGTYVIPETPILVVTATSLDPELAAAMANQLAQTLIENNPDSLPDDLRQTMESHRQQINELQNQISVASLQSVTVFQRLNDAREAGDDELEAQLNNEYNSLIDQLNSARSILAQLSDTFVALSDRENNLSIFELADIPEAASSISPKIIGIAGVLIGVMLAVGIILFMDYVDPNVRTESEAIRVLDLPVLGVIAGKGNSRGAREEYLTTGTLTKAAASEQYRAIQANLLFSPEGRRSSNTYIIASPDVQEGRSFTTANLALIVAETGLQVLLVDADLRDPEMHDIFGLKNKAGLTDLLQIVTENADAFKGRPKEQIIRIFNTYIQGTRTPGLDVITIGSRQQQVISQSSSVKNVQTIIENIEKALVYDIIIFDTPNTKDVADSYILAGATRANVILLVKLGKTNRNEALRAKSQFLRVGSKISGIVVDKG